ncbi:MAG: hypothetical protein LBV43_15540 [Prevotella sp.]|jgi:hypothetical protein|nr:hypothetical protein [Prevotella sp.]
MSHLSNFDYLYAALFLLFGIFMIVSPRTLMRGAKYDEESLKTEKWVKRLGIVLCIFAVGFAISLYIRLQNA